MKKLGGGNFGVVNAITFRGRKMAAKLLKLPANFATATAEEQALMKKQLVEGPQILRKEAATMKDLEGATGVVQMYRANFDDDDVMRNCLFMEFMDATLLEFIHGSFSDSLLF